MSAPTGTLPCWVLIIITPFSTVTLEHRGRPPALPVLSSQVTLLARRAARPATGRQRELRLLERDEVFEVFPVSSCSRATGTGRAAR